MTNELILPFNIDDSMLLSEPMIYKQQTGQLGSR